ncbi:hypothetical protein QN224_15575 [Sinorhizobium sp. 8-89]|uniref:hypothetical protein n=1 Tax=Sinorhizobium sp. 7-81 TaxID=3049087 RepID=UPI0024C41920|nr:hypothetical protein [Sinorhizobium sp. 7-81]MDK1386829.1 hypothetical protein [Sinorhizobium sp. 7-81]
MTIDKDRKAISLAVYGAFCGSAAIFLALCLAFWAWRVNSFPHSVATVTSVRDEVIAVRSRGLDTGRRKTVTVGTI